MDTKVAAMARPHRAHTSVQWLCVWQVSGPVRWVVATTWAELGFVCMDWWVRFG